MWPVTRISHEHLWCVAEFFAGWNKFRLEFLEQKSTRYESEFFEDRAVTSCKKDKGMSVVVWRNNVMPQYSWSITILCSFRCFAFMGFTWLRKARTYSCNICCCAREYDYECTYRGARNILCKSPVIKYLDGFKVWVCVWPINLTQTKATCERFRLSGRLRCVVEGVASGVSEYEETAIVRSVRQYLPMTWRRRKWVVQINMTADPNSSSVLVSGVRILKLERYRLD